MNLIKRKLLDYSQNNGESILLNNMIGIPQEEKSIIIESFDFKDWMEKFENNFSKIDKTIYLKEKTLEEKILKILTSSHYRKGGLTSLNFDIYKENFLKKIKNKIINNETIKIILPAFSFKHTNLLKCRRKTPDLGDIASLTRLYEITRLIQEFYKPGAIIEILSDGSVHTPIFRDNVYFAEIYFNGIKDIVVKLGIQNNIKITSMEMILDKHSSLINSFYKDCYKDTEFKFKNYQKDQNIKCLRDHIKHNLNLGKITLDILYSTLHKNPSEIALDNEIIQKVIEKQTDLSCFEYILLHSLIYASGVLDLEFPDALRATTHPKEGQLGLHLVNSKTQIVPWMGIGGIKKDGSVRVKHEIDFIKDNSYTPVYIRGEDLPFYYIQY